MEMDQPEQPIRKKVLGIALPAIGSNLLRLLVTTVDMIMVGRLGYIQIAAVGTSNILIFLFQAIMMAIANGSMIVVANYFGKKKYEEASEVLSESAWVCIILGIVLGSIGFFFGRDALSLITNSPEVLGEAEGYLSIVMLAMPFMFFGFLCANVFRGAGDTVTPLWVGGISNVLNIILDYLLIFGVHPFPAMGVRGAALGTSISFFVNSLIYLTMLLSKKSTLRIRFSLKATHLSEVFYIGLPTAVERIGIQGSNFVYTGMIGLFGEIALAAHLIGIRVEALSFMPGFGFYTSSAVLVGQSLGSGNEKLAKRYANESMKMGIVLMGSIGVFMLIFPEILASLFTVELEVIKLCRIYLILMGLSQVATAVDFAVTGALRGSGNTLFPMYATLFSRFLVRLPVAYLLGYTTGLGVTGVWLGMMADMFFKAFVVYAKFRKDGFKKSRYAAQS